MSRSGWDQFRARSREAPDWTRSSDVCTGTLDHVEFPNVYLDATYLHMRSQTSQVVSLAVVVATGVSATGEREILGLDVADSEDEFFCKGFMTSPKQRGLAEVRQVISDQQVKALRRCFEGTAHQRCRATSPATRSTTSRMLRPTSSPVTEPGARDQRVELAVEVIGVPLGTTPILGFVDSGPSACHT